MHGAAICVPSLRPAGRSRRSSRPFTMRRADCAPKSISPSTSAWSRQLAAIRSDVSSMLKSEIEATPGRVRRLLRPRPAKEIAPGSLLDAIDVSEAEARVEFVSVCRHYAGELAVSEVTLRTFSELRSISKPAPGFCLTRCVTPTMPTGRSGSLRSAPRSGFAERCSEPTMRAFWPRPPTSRYILRPSSVRPARA